MGTLGNYLSLIQVLVSLKLHYKVDIKVVAEPKSNFKRRVIP